jgi:hypothetical protein
VKAEASCAEDGSVCRIERHKGVTPRKDTPERANSESCVDHNAVTTPGAIRGVMAPSRIFVGRHRPCDKRGWQVDRTPTSFALVR